MTDGEQNETNGFERAFREWAARPPATSPLAAARRVTARLPGSGARRRIWRWAAAVAVLTAAVAVPLLRHRPAAPPECALAVPLPQPDNVVIDHAGSGLTVYFIISAPEAYGGTNG